MNDDPREMRVRLKPELDSSDLNFARHTMRREANRELREARHHSYSDIGAA